MTDLIRKSDALTAPDRETPSTSWAVWAWQAYRDGRLVEASETHTPLADALVVVLDALKDGEVWGRAVNGASAVLNSGMPEEYWTRPKEIREALDAALRAIGERAK